MSIRAFTLCISALVMGADSAHAVDLILRSGKIVTVDRSFSIAEAVAIDGDRIVAVGTDERVSEHARKDTRIVELGGRTVIPGLIDGHIHFARGAERWSDEVRLDGVTERANARRLIAARASTLGRGAWIMVLGGWSEDQFADDRRPFTRAELDDLALENPTFLQVSYSHAFANTAALHAAGVDPESPGREPPGAVERDSAGRATGRLNGFVGIQMVRRHLPPVPEKGSADRVRRFAGDLNRLGITAVFDPGGFGVSDATYAGVEALVSRGELRLRVFRTLWLQSEALGDIARLVANIHAAKPFGGSDLLDVVGIGEALYLPVHDDYGRAVEPTPVERAAMRSLLAAAASGGWPIHLHAHEASTIALYLELINEIRVSHPIDKLGWTIAHASMITPEQIDQMAQMGMRLALQSPGVFEGPLRQRINGDLALVAPPLAEAEHAGLPWGLGSDATVAGQINPFITLGWAVSGRMPGGSLVLRSTVSREAALIAHTRANAEQAFRGADLGSIEPGKLADLVVIDRDYLTVPAEDIWRTRALITVAGGVIVHDEMPR
jgi:hypothetical protein